MSGIAQDVRLDMLRKDVERCGPAAVKLFEQILAQGEGAEFAAMCACQQAPGSRNTDRAFCEGQRRKMERMSAVNRNGIIEIARRAGIQTDGKFYMSGLGRYDNPAAWVSSAGDLTDSLKAQNKSCEGVINYTPKTLRPAEPQPEPALAEDLIQEMETKYLQADPGLREKVRKKKHARRELREKIIAKHGRPKKRR